MICFVCSDLGSYREYIGSPDSNQELRAPTRNVMETEDPFLDLQEAVLFVELFSHPSEIQEYRTLRDLLEIDEEYKFVFFVHFPHYILFFYQSVNIKCEK